MMVRDELAEIGRDGQLPSGAIICGGAVKMPGIVDLSREVLQLPVQLGFPQNIEGIVDRVDDPSFATAIGLLHFANRYGSSRSLLDFDFGRIFGSAINFFKKLIP